MNPQIFSQLIQPNHHILELGPGAGHMALYFVKHFRTRVTAVDRRARPENMNHPDLNWIQNDIQAWIKQHDSTIFNHIWSRFCIPFLPKDWLINTLFPFIDQHTTPSAQLAIAAFYDNPIPAFEKTPILPSLWTPTEIAKHFPNWKIRYSSMNARHDKDLAGIVRRFFYTEIILQKPDDSHGHKKLPT